VLTMGVVTSSLTVRSTDVERLMAELATRVHCAYVGPPENGCTVVFDRGSEDDLLELRVLVERLSDALACAALAVAVHDDKSLLYFLGERGSCVDEYVSSPGYFEARETAPQGGDAGRLSAAFGSGERRHEIDEVLRRPSADAVAEGGYAYERVRHRDLARLLGLPLYAVAAGFRAIEEGSVPSGFPPAVALRKIGS
jgi:hypothetical protein